MMSPISEAYKIITSNLRDIHGPKNVRTLRNGDICWVEKRGAWRGFRWVFLSYVSGYSEEFIRLRNDTQGISSKSLWPFERPTIETFELTVLASEITPEFVSDFSRFVSFLAENRDEIYTWDMFAHQSYPTYSWSTKAQVRLDQVDRERA